EEGWRVHKDATQFWASAVVTPISDSSARFLGFVNVIRDLTGQKAAADALRETEERSRAFLDHSPNWMFIKDTDGHYCMVNQAFADVHGLTKQQIVGKSDDELFSPDLAAVFRGYDRRVLETGEPVEYDLTPRTGALPRWSMGQNSRCTTGTAGSTRSAVW